MELTVTNRSRAYPGRSSEDSKVDEVQYVVLKVCYLCTSGSVVEYRLAKARVAGSNPVSRSFYLTQESCNSKVSCVFCIEGGDLCTGRAGYRLDSQMSAINI